MSPIPYLTNSRRTSWDLDRVGDILQQQLGSGTGRLFSSKQTGRLRHNDREDYITARGANPRTGVVSPGQNSSLESNSDDSNNVPERKTFIIQRWRQKNDQWVSMGVTRKSTSETSRPMSKSKELLRKSLKPSNGLTSSGRSDNSTQCLNGVVTPLSGTSELQVPVSKHMLESEDASIISEDLSHSDKIKTAVDALSHGIMDSAEAIASVALPRTKTCSYHWGDAAVSHYDTLARSGGTRSQRLCGIKSSAVLNPLCCAAPCQSEHVELDPTWKSTPPENKLSRVTESSEPDNHKGQQRTQSNDSLAQPNDEFTRCLTGQTSHTSVSLANTRNLQSAALGATSHSMKERNAEKGSMSTTRRLARSKQAQKAVTPGPTHFRIKRKPLGERPNPGLLKCHAKTGCTNAAVRQASRHVNVSNHGSRRARKLDARNRRLNDLDNESSKLASPIITRSQNQNPSGIRRVDHIIAATDGAFERNSKAAGSSNPGNRKSSDFGQHISSGESGNVSGPAGDLPPDIAGEENLPMTAFLIATLMFIRDFIMDRKTFRYFMSIFGYLLQMISHTLYVALVICNAFFIGLRTASPRQSCAYLREIKYFSDDLYHALCYVLLLTFVFGAAWKFVDYFFESMRLVLWLYRVLRGFTFV
ncbi:hypothetical protein KEM54_004552 [Ascosphaera aggregata]|nr:hypothetical protein KEM54_004552 [Ascosphaera aggregata]